MLLLFRYLVEMFRGLLGHPRRNREATTTASRAAMVQVSVLSGARAALEVVHDWDGSWTVSDGMSDLDMPGQAVATHLSRAALWDDSITGLATMEPGRVARRSNSTEAWRISSLAI
jgi:hypothetical protein